MDKNTGNETEGVKKISKPLTVFILIGVMAVLAWSAIQIVKIFPSALNSLASIAETVYTYKPKADTSTTTPSGELLVNIDRDKMNSNELLYVWWDNKNSSGTYTFNYKCQDGIAIDLKSAEKDFSSISCGSNYDLGLVDKIEVRIDSEKNRFQEVIFDVMYFKKNDTNPSNTVSKTVTILNSTIPELDLTNNTDNISPEIKDEEHDNIPTPPPTENPSPVKPAVKPVTPKVEPTYIYEIPISNPNGQIDLALSNLLIGKKDISGKFFTTNFIFKNSPISIQFTVHNIGNKTSEIWTFETNLSGKVNYKSDQQSPLKPNERSIITLELPTIEDQDFGVLIKTKTDKNTNNNYLATEITVR